MKSTTLWIKRTLAFGIAYSLVGWTPTYGQQETARPSDIMPTEGIDVPADAATPPPPVEQTAPYNTWKKHTGKAEEALALVRLQLTGGGSRSVQGLVLRCDGFVLLPLGGLAERLEASPVEVATVEAEGRGAGGLLAAVRLTEHRGGWRHAPSFALAKVNGTHVPSVPLLDPAHLRAGLRVRVVYARPHGGGRIAAAPALSAVVADPPEDPNAPRRNAAEWALEAVRPASEAGSAAPPLGASVVDEESGAVLGMVTGSRGGRALFTSFLYLHEFTNEVGLAPSRDAAVDRFKRAQQDAERPAREDPTIVEGTASKMVWVPGGPVWLRGAVLARYRDEYRVEVACTPGFWIDAFPVTNGEYRPFARSVLAGDSRFRLPWHWAESGELVRERRNNGLPVTGVGAEEAALYATRSGKRLPTAVEFLRASEGAAGPWVQETLAAWRRMDEGVRRVRDELARLDHRARVKQNARQVHGKYNAKKTSGLFNIAINEVDDEAIRYVFDRFSPTFDADLFTYGYPHMISPIGMREEDRSRFGVRDTVMNAPELIQPVWLRKPQENAGKEAPALRDPHLDGVVQTGAHTSLSVSAYIDRKDSRFASTILRQAIYSVKWQIGPGFRCAR